MKKKRTDYTDEEWSNLSNKDKLNCFISDKPSSFLKDVKWRQDNHYWLGPTTCIAIKILFELRDKNITKQKLAKETKITIKRINNLVKGKEDLKLSEILRIEKVLNIKLINLIEGYSLNE